MQERVASQLSFDVHGTHERASAICCPSQNLVPVSCSACRAHPEQRHVGLTSTDCDLRFKDLALN